MKRNIYLEDIPLDEAWAAFTSALEESDLWQPFPSEIVPVAGAAGRVTAEPVWARLSAPHYHASAMDGYAVRARDTEGATETLPLVLNLLSVDETDPRQRRPALPVNTGQPMPAWANAVIMIEHTQQVEDPGGVAGIEIRSSVPPWHHVRPMGEDMVATELVLPANHRLRPVDLGALAGSGHATVTVYRRPRVAVIPTGSELLSLDEVAQNGISAGQIIEYNSIVLSAQVEGWGALATRWPIAPDSFEAIQEAVRIAAADHDLILVNAGSSAGSEDYTAHVVRSLGRLLVHGVAVRPGHPVILGLAEPQAEDDAAEVSPVSVPIVGVPGYPVSAALTGEIFVEPLLARWAGQPANRPPTLEATVTRKIASHTGDDDFVRVAVGKVGERIMATPISRGAGVITSLVRADGLIQIPRFSEGVEAGAAVTVRLYRMPAEIERTIVAIGSHDLTLDLLAQFLAERGEGARLASANVGSLGGLIALRRGEAHLAGAHLLDPESGEYNSPYVRRYLQGQEIVMLTLVGREQGWIVPAGNPKDLAGWSDAINPDLRIVNRQRGAGTRLLLDYQLGLMTAKPEEVRGYDREEYTHLAVAAAVASGAADAGLGIRAAARALQLDFVPLTQERYDLLIPRQHYESDLLEPLLSLLHEPAFRDSVANMPGYDVSKMGHIAGELK
ncbi:MAG: molybdopterin biosynthesis protein [Chloroflexota bacterium]|nr:MAG: molybdopterin biosynthesis protein [Chloroflexota bacterium]